MFNGKWVYKGFKGLAMYGQDIRNRAWGYNDVGKLSGLRLSKCLSFPKQAHQQAPPCHNSRQRDYGLEKSTPCRGSNQMMALCLKVRVM